MVAVATLLLNEDRYGARGSLEVRYLGQHDRNIILSVDRFAGFAGAGAGKTIAVVLCTDLILD